jgi:MraZ protein
MFLGRYKTLFSGKNRLVLPKKFRMELGSDNYFYVVGGRDGELWGFGIREWTVEAEKRLAIPLTEKAGRIERRNFFGQAEECQLDGQGRFIISQQLVDYAGLGNEVLIIGCGDHFEIWDQRRIEEKLEEGTND